MKYIFTILTTLLFITGCGSTYTKPIPSGVVENKDIVITAEDGSFKLQGNFESPFESSAHFHSYNVSGNKLIKAYRKAIEFDAKYVRVKVPNLDKELYGVLVLDNADERGIGQGVKTYKIIIPKAYIEATKGGKISVMYEYYHINDEGSLSDLSEVKKYSWILWISDEDIFR